MFKLCLFLSFATVSEKDLQIYIYTHTLKLLLKIKFYDMKEYCTHVSQDNKKTA